MLLVTKVQQITTDEGCPWIYRLLGVIEILQKQQQK